MKRFLIQSMSLSVLALSTAGLLSVVLAPSSAEAKSAAGLDRAVDSTVDAFMQDHKGAKQLMDLAKGVLVFPNLVKGAVGIGGEFGEGALRVNGETVGYYNKVSLSAGFQLGGQAKSLLVFFFDDDELQDFRRSNGWQVGVDGAIVVLGYGANGSSTRRTSRTRWWQSSSAPRA
jgi:lipid-binding SYLF domain-containing protein